MPDREIRRVGTWSLAKFYGTFGVIYGLLVGLPFLVFGSVVREGLGFGMFLGIIIGAAFFGLVAGTVTALIYNVIAGVVGGIEVEVVSG